MIWGRLILLVAMMSIVQVYLTLRQVQAYQRTVRQMARRPDGFLGVGSARKALRPGAVVVLVADAAGCITQGKAMHGMTVFARLQPFERYTGRNAEAALLAARGEGQAAVARASCSALEQILAQKQRADKRSETGEGGDSTAAVAG